MILPSLSRSDKIHPKTEKINPWRPEFENVLFDRRRSWKCTKRAVISYEFSVIHLGILNVPPQLRDDHRAQGSGKILQLDDHAFEWPFLKNKKLNPMHSNERRRRRRKENFLLCFQRCTRIALCQPIEFAAWAVKSATFFYFFNVVRELRFVSQSNSLRGRCTASKMIADFK